MTSMPWIKLYVEILDDVKMSRLEDAQKWRFVQLLLLAGDCDAEGALVTGDSPMTINDVTWRLRCDSKELEKDMDKFIDMGLVIVDESAFVIAKWTDRQGPTQAEKRKQWRERQRKRRERLKKDNVTQESPVTPDRVTLLEEEEEEDKEINARPPYDEMMSEWQRLFPDKPQPRMTDTLRSKINTRWKSDHFQENWRRGLEMAAGTKFLHSKDASWFDFRWFVKNDEHYQKCLDNWMAWKDGNKKDGRAVDLEGYKYAGS